MMLYWSIHEKNCRGKQFFGREMNANAIGDRKMTW